MPSCTDLPSTAPTYSRWVYMHQCQRRHRTQIWSWNVRPQRGKCRVSFTDSNTAKEIILRIDFAARRTQLSLTLTFIAFVLSICVFESWPDPDGAHFCFCLRYFTIKSLISCISQLLHVHQIRHRPFWPGKKRLRHAPERAQMDRIHYNPPNYIQNTYKCIQHDYLIWNKKLKFF